MFEQAVYRANTGKINVLYGESGSGKSTLIQTLLFRHSCRYMYNGRDLSKCSEEEQAAFLAGHVSVFF